uniref:Protein sel-1 homolog 3-like n=1 Tax=Ciona intestinalis TaxID=7719 RepID=H2XS81_CIOIN|nr:protein sel-1 homolog 3-like [Ciona intestinalis]|eukprot:XP_018669638.1 protein sel-1 homolog 3-like [Ciona intestinalis]
MGDYYYNVNATSEDLEKALKYYTVAAKFGFPQAMFNVATVLDKHRNISSNIVESTLQLAQKREDHDDRIISIYKKCTELPTRESLLPCHIALVKARLWKIWKMTPLSIKVFSVFISVVMMVVIYFLTHQNTNGSIEFPA